MQRIRYEYEDEDDYENDNEECNCRQCYNRQLQFQEEEDVYEEEEIEEYQLNSCDEQEYEQSLIDIFQQICDFFQLPSSYKEKKIMAFKNTELISDYEFLEKNAVSKNEITILIKKCLQNISYEYSSEMKKIRVMIFFQILNLKNVREFITMNNEFFDVVKIKFDEFSEIDDDDQSENLDFNRFIRQFNFCI